MPQPTYYQRAIREELARRGRIAQYDPRHVEAWLRLEYGTLSHLSGARLVAPDILDTIDAATHDESENLARSFGL